MDENEPLPTSFEFLKYIRHHFVGHVQKVTPSGRLQSALIALVDEGITLCSNRGGIHRFVPLVNLDSVRIYPRARLLLVFKDQHNLLVVSRDYQRIVSALTYLMSGTFGVALKVERSEQQLPSADTLELNPAPEYVGRVPSTLRTAIQHAKTVRARAEVASVYDALSGRGTADGTVVGGQADDGVGGGLQSAQQQLRGTNLGLAEEKEKNTDLLPFPSLQTAQPIRIENQPLTILVAVVGTSTSATFPAPDVLWEYLTCVAGSLPGARQPPCVQVRNVASGATIVCEVNHGLFVQTMRMLSAQVPHTVTVQCSGAASGAVCYDSEVYWRTSTVQ